MGRKYNLPEVSQETENQLISYAKSHKVEHRMALRSQIILDWMNGLSYKASASKNDVTEMIIAKWRKRFAMKGMEGLKDAERSGKPITISEETRKKVIHLACSKPEDGRRKRSQKDIARITGISQSKVSQILLENELRPHKTEYWCGKSPDPEFETKMIDIVGLYLNPPSNAIVLSVDEKTQIQALDRTQPELPMKKGQVRRLTNTYKRNGIVNLIAALAVHTGEVTARNIDRNNADNFLKFLRLIDRKYRNVEIHIIIDNLAVHKNKEVKEWLNRKRKFHVHYTPTYSSWLNQIETWFSIMTRDVLKDSVWRSKKELVDELMRYIKMYNKHKAKPFQWTYGNHKIN